MSSRRHDRLARPCSLPISSDNCSTGSGRCLDSRGNLLGSSAAGFVTPGSPESSRKGLPATAHSLAEAVRKIHASLSFAPTVRIPLPNRHSG